MMKRMREVIHRTILTQGLTKRTRKWTQ
jgi:hypothetical protein